VKRGSTTRRLARCRVEAALQNARPMGVGYLHRRLRVAMVDVRAFEAACGHFGLRGVLRDVTPGEVAAEVRARRGRGDEPSAGLLPALLDERFSREEDDARMAIVKRRIAEARAAAPRRAPTPRRPRSRARRTPARGRRAKTSRRRASWPRRPCAANRGHALCNGSMKALA